MSKDIICQAYSKEYGMLDIVEIHFDDEWVRSSTNIELKFENVELFFYKLVK
jgi:hypothetical protein